MKKYYVYDVMRSGVVVPDVSEDWDLIDCEVLSSTIKEVCASNAVEALLKAGIDEDVVLDIIQEEIEFGGIHALLGFGIIDGLLLDKLLRIKMT